MNAAPMHALDGAAAGARARRSRWTVALILAVCVAPVLASYFFYYVVRPEGRVNYGTLVEPQRDLSGAVFAGLDGGPLPMASLAGKWVMVTLAPGACDDACARRLWTMRQVRLTTGANRDRVERLLLITDDGTPPAPLLAQHEGLRVARIANRDVARWFATSRGGDAGDRVWIVDPRGNLMMRYPEHADPERMKKDLARLLRASGAS